MTLQHQLETARQARIQLERLQEQSDQVETLEKLVTKQRLQRSAQSSLDYGVQRAQGLVDNAANSLQETREKFPGLVSIIEDIIDDYVTAQKKIMEAQRIVVGASGQMVYAGLDESAGSDKSKLLEIRFEINKLAASIWESLATGRRLAFLNPTQAEDRLSDELLKLLLDTVRQRLDGRSPYVPSQRGSIRWSEIN